MRRPTIALATAAALVGASGCCFCKKKPAVPAPTPVYAPSCPTACPTGCPDPCSSSGAAAPMYGAGYAPSSVNYGAPAGPYGYPMGPAN